MAKMRPAPTPTLSKPVGLGDISWSKDAAVSVESKDGKLQIVTDGSAGELPIGRRRSRFRPGMIPVVRLQGTVHEGAVSLGILNESKDRWLGSRNFEAGRSRTT